MAPEPLGPPVMDAPVTPVGVSAKSPASTPVTASEKVTVQLTELALVGLEPTRTIEETVGAVVSLVTLTTSLAPVLVAASVTHTRSVFAPSFRLAAPIAVATEFGDVEYVPVATTVPSLQFVPPR